MLASLKEVLEEGKKRNIAVGNFNTPNLEMLNAQKEMKENARITMKVFAEVKE